MRRLLEAIVEGAETRKDSVNHSPFIVLFLIFLSLQYTWLNNRPERWLR